MQEILNILKYFEIKKINDKESSWADFLMIMPMPAEFKAASFFSNRAYG